MTDRLIELACEIFDLNEGEVSLESSTESLDAWDSLNHLRLITAVEQEFSVKFTMSEIESIKTMAALQSLVSERA